MGRLRPRKRKVLGFADARYVAVWAPRPPVEGPVMRTMGVRGWVNWRRKALTSLACSFTLQGFDDLRSCGVEIELGHGDFESWIDWNSERKGKLKQI